MQLIIEHEHVLGRSRLRVGFRHQHLQRVHLEERSEHFVDGEEGMPSIPPVPARKRRRLIPKRRLGFFGELADTRFDRLLCLGLGAVGRYSPFDIIWVGIGVQ
ncbi:MAG: hypothetical protein WDM77_06530 [Steroidobacteraceae bacterium]